MHHPTRTFPHLTLVFFLMGATACSDDSNPRSGNNNNNSPYVQQHDTVRSELARDTSPNVSDEDFETLIAGNHTFTFDIYNALKAEEGNLLVSPFSIRMAFGLLQAGAAGQTETEIKDVLRFGLDQDELHPAFNALDLALAERNWPGDDDFNPVQLYVANAFWGQTGYPWKADYLDTLALNYGAGVEALDFQNEPNPSRLIINDWVEAKTNDRIKDLLPEGSITPGTVAVLTNALFLKAPWASPFEEFMTQPTPFTTLDSTEVEVEMMRQTAQFGYVSGNGYQALEMPYHQGELSMVFLLPDAGEFQTFEDNLSSAQFNSIIDSLEQKQGSAGIPKFQFESGFLLSDTLKALGMVTAFGSADLSRMIDNGNLAIDEVYHKTFIAVDEEGTEAAAATAIVISETSMPMEEFNFTADRPFLLAIRDRLTGTILFFGRYTTPE